MLEQSVHNLKQIAETDPTVRPLAILQVEVLRAVADPAWEASAAMLGPGRVQFGEPLLHNQTLPVDRERMRSLLERLVNTAGRANINGSEALRRAMAGGWRSDPLLDPLALVHASITWDIESLERMTGEVGVDLPVLVTLGDLATRPLLLACGRKAVELMPNIPWTVGYCPFCAAWPTLAELRGLERQHWLRCGRCGSGWRLRHQQCLFCSNTDHETLGYLASEKEKESRRAVICNACGSYIKTLTTVVPLTPPEIITRDLTSLELDMAALEQGYSRPQRPGFPLQIELIPAPHKKQGWLPWR